jgi:hypothetical protein
VKASPPRFLLAEGRRGEKRPLSVPLCGWSVEPLPTQLAASGFVWPNNRSGEPTGNVTHTLSKLADAAKVRRLSLHDLRATGNTWLANHGIDERLRQYLMGHHAGGPVIHRDTKVTADTEKQLRETVAVFDEIRASRENVASLRIQPPQACVSSCNPLPHPNAVRSTLDCFDGQESAES